MAWTEVRFGKHSGKTLPQILLSDPDWFFWAKEKNVFNTKGALRLEAENINYKARNIKIPKNEDKSLSVEYVIHPPTGKFSHFDIVPADNQVQKGGSATY